MKINVIDNFFDEKDFKDFEKHIVNNGDFPWFLAFDTDKTVHNDHYILKSNDVPKSPWTIPKIQLPY